MTLSLTPAQQEALRLDCPIFIEAGAGSGKTSVLIQRYLNILDNEADTTPLDIAVITFTKDAEHELKDRLSQTLNNGTLRPFTQKKLLEGLPRAKISTIHSFCSEIIREHALFLGIDPMFRIAEGAESGFLIDDAVAYCFQLAGKTKNNSLKFCLSTVSRFRLTQHLRWLLLHPDAFCLSSPDPIDLEGDDLQTLYFHHLKQVGTFGLNHLSKLKKAKAVLFFDDLIPLATQALQDPNCLQKTRESLKHLMVDEFQDTDKKQWKLIELLSDPFSQQKEKKPLLCIVGDVKQSIYRFREADALQFLSVLNQFEEQPLTKVVKLCDNFRTCETVLSSINQLSKTIFESDPEHRIPYTSLKPARSHNGSLSLIQLTEDHQPHDEFDAIIHWIKHQLASNPTYSYADICILFRRTTRFKQLKEKLDHANIPSHFSHQQGLFQKEIVIDTYQLLKSLMQPHDPLSWIRVFSSTYLKLSYDHLYWLKKSAPDLGLFEALCKISSNATHVPDSIFQELCQTSTLVQTWISHCAFRPLPNVLRAIVNESMILNTLSVDDQEALTQFLDILETTFESANGNFHHFLESVDRQMLRTDTPSEKTSKLNAVRIMTIHASKGLEFPVVIIGECGKDLLSHATRGTVFNEKGIVFPLSEETKTDTTQQILDFEMVHSEQEYKRLFYVACTRAKDHLTFIGIAPKVSKTERKTLSFFDFIVQNDAIKADIEALKIAYFQSVLALPKLTHYAITPPKNVQIKPLPTQSARLDIPNTPNAQKTILKLSVSQAEAGLTCSKKAKLFPVIQELASNPSFKIENPYTSESVHGANIGQAVHRVFYQCNTFPEKKPSELIPSLSGLSHSDVSFVTDAILSLKQQPFYKHTSSKDALHEYPFLIRLDQLILEGRLDTAVIIDGVWTIIDYKTDAVTNETYLAYSEKYLYQLGLYAIAIEQCFKVKTPINGMLYFTQCQKTVPFSFTKEDRDQIKIALQSIYDTLFHHRFTPPKKETCLSCPYFKVDPECPNKLN